MQEFAFPRHMPSCHRVDGGAQGSVSARPGDVAVQVQDSKDPDGPSFTFDTAVWTAFPGYAAHGSGIAGAPSRD
jgi:hypothetical protein